MVGRFATKPGEVRGSAVDWTEGAKSMDICHAARRSGLAAWGHWGKTSSRVYGRRLRLGVDEAADGTLFGGGLLASLRARE